MKWIGSQLLIKVSFDKGKPGESRGRKAMGLPAESSVDDCQAAENEACVFIMERMIKNWFEFV